MGQAVSPRILIACAALLAAGPAGAAAWQGDQAAGKLQFVATQAGAKFTGGFTKFQVCFDFDPAKPADGRLDVTVTTASADTLDDERDAMLTGEDFLWTGKHPEATFHAEKFRREGKRWRADGLLTLRGVARPVTVRFQVAPAGGGLAMKGDAKLRRLAFGVGRGEWESTEWIGDEVEVRFDLRLAPAPAAASP